MEERRGKKMREEKQRKKEIKYEKKQKERHVEI